MKKWLALILSAVLLLSLAACNLTEKAQELSDSLEDGLENAGVLEETPKPDDTEGEKTFTVIVVHKDGTEKTFTYTSDAEFVGPVLTEAGLLKGNDGPYGLEITEVDGEKAVYAEDNAYWAVYENGEYAMQGIDTTPITDGGEYKLEYTPA